MTNQMTTTMKVCVLPVCSGREMLWCIHVYFNSHFIYFIDGPVMSNRSQEGCQEQDGRSEGQDG